MEFKIVLAEDDPQIARLVTFKLDREGYLTTWADDGGKAYEAIVSILPDLVILDVMMPVMTGFEVLEKMKNNETTRNIPVIILTSKSQEQDVLKGFSLGISDYIIKPFSPSELIARIKRTLGG